MRRRFSEDPGARREMPTAAEASRALRERADPALAQFHARYFRTGPGEYGEGERFLGIKVPTTRLVARGFRTLAMPEIARLLKSDFHEERLFALIVLVHQAQRAKSIVERRTFADFYLANRARVNNWDLVDVSAEHVLGPLRTELQPTLDKLSRSKSIWDRRISILAHMHEIRQATTKPFLKFATRFLDDEEDLIQKANGWLLRECGNKDVAGLRGFLDAHAQRMPRTMLRYAIEKLPPAERKRYLSAK